MPQKTVYIREEDLEQWNETNKARLVRNALKRERQARVDRLKGRDPDDDLSDQETPRHKPLGRPPLPVPEPVPSEDDELVANAAPTIPLNDKLYAIVIEDTQTVIKKDMSFMQADEALLKLNVEGNMTIKEQPK